MKKLIERNGGIRYKKGGIILTINSMPFARYLLSKKINMLNIKYSNDSFIIKRGNSHKIHFERVKINNPLCVAYVTKILLKKIKNELKESKKQKRVKIKIIDIISEDNLINYNNQISYKLPKIVNPNIPPKEKIKVCCFVSAFKNKSGFNYRFSIRHRILKDIAQRKEKIMVSRNKKGYFLITRDSKGSLFSLYTNPKGHPLTYLQISPTLITKDELNLFRKGRRSISSKAFLSKEEFNLNISKFFINKEEQTLASALINKNFNIQIPEMRKREADIILQDYNIQIEITRLKPRSISNKNNPHGEGAHINARLCEGFLRVTKGIVPYFFVILHKNWLKYQWVNDLINMVKPKVISITTSFENKWEKDVAESIKNNIKRLNLKK